MKKFLPTCLLLGALTTLQKNAQAQNWQLVWQDEFDNGISADWVFETGNGTNGWGNNELQYYRRENATVENGQLVITAKRESIGGYNYTSTRMKTQGKKSWKYGKIEARIKMPAFSGIWPAFWMLGDNISTVGWPACGEIDVMEHINAENITYGTPHWLDNNNQHASYSGNTACTVTDYHVYTVEWDANYIRWFLDGAKFHEMYIGGGINGTSEFQNNHFILLNMAVGGNWPGFNIDLNGFPAKMYVDWVRVYQDNGTPPPPPPGTLIQAESYSNMQGVQTEATTDAGGGTNVGWIDATDWLAYNPIVFPTTGTYKIEYRVASLNGGGRLSLDLNAGAIVLGELAIPSTGGWQNWTTISHNVHVNAGTYTPGIYAIAGGWNLNWFRITPLTAKAARADMLNNLIDNSVQTGKAFNIYPNPVQQQLNILSGESLTGGLIRIFDMSGKQVMTARPATNRLDVSALAPGVYTLVFTKNKTRITREFVK
ncbi:carbohydrate-binding protein [Niastella caeni]|uniref:Carbohydrate-binding protein n=1 Tax=Niastella caeni TaxID=2569763 RepID=A0A4S8HQ29_9BACT|nr:carbohydrate-binding protein [Niastella caeni]THU36024.1 carbohydrate-binding protein [Niastella caeni]